VADFFLRRQTFLDELFFKICQVPFRRVAEAMLHPPCLVAVVQFVPQGTPLRKVSRAKLSSSNQEKNARKWSMGSAIFLYLKRHQLVCLPTIAIIGGSKIACIGDVMSRSERIDVKLVLALLQLCSPV